MSPRQPGRPRADRERDLRGDLLRTSRSLLDAGGTAALSMREVARRAGCTHQAPYHYFEDRETILATLVVEGFRELASRLKAANDLAPAHGVRAALNASGRAYVDFALSQPGVFRIMFRPDVCNPLRFPAVLEAGAGARAELDRLSRIAHGSRATRAQASILWAHVHGLACLLIDGPLAMAFETDRQRQHHLDEVATAFADMLLSRQVEAAAKPGRRRKNDAA
jgi:AcrR family transcriptional regulator